MLIRKDFVNPRRWLVYFSGGPRMRREYLAAFENAERAAVAVGMFTTGSYRWDAIGSCSFMTRAESESICELKNWATSSRS